MNSGGAIEIPPAVPMTTDEAAFHKLAVEVFQLYDAEESERRTLTAARSGWQTWESPPKFGRLWY